MIKLTAKQLRLKKKSIKDYIQAGNAADGSMVDSNANVNSKNIATLESELNKDINIQVNRALVSDKIKTLFGDYLADEYIRQIEDHEIYVHDETSLKPYCVSVTMYPFLTDGLQSLNGESKPPQHIESFCGSFINFMFAVSSQFAGAVATVEFLLYFDYFAKKDLGENYLITHTKKIQNLLQQVVYSINQPAAARGYQSIFWNISIFDKFYFDSMFGHFTFPGETVPPQWESLKNLQEFFLSWINTEREKAILTFPVVTIAMLKDSKAPKDTEFAEMCASQMESGNSFFVYMSDDVDSLASCCFDGQQKVLTKSSNGVNLLSFDEFHNSKYKENKQNLTIYHNGSWVAGKSVKVSGVNKDMYRVTTSNNKVITLTEDHLNPTLNGDILTKHLNKDDYLMFNTQKLDAVPERDENLSYEQGVLIGAFLGDGSFGGRITLADGTVKIYETSFSLNSNCYDELKKNIDIAAKQCGSGNELKLSTIHNNVYPTRISSQEVVNFIKRWVIGHKHDTKTLNMDCLLQNSEFRKGILDGAYLTDGGNSNRIYSVSQGIIDSLEIVISSLGMNSTISTSDRTDEKVVIRGEEFNRNFPLHCIRWYDSKNRRSMKDVYIVKNNSVFFKIKSIDKLPEQEYVYCFEMKNLDEPYFTLPNGLITHNCRLRNELTDNIFSHTLGAGGVATGSINVITININRLVQDGRDLRTEIQKIHKYQLAYRKLIEEYLNAGLLPVYDAGFIQLKKQFLTIGINGFVEAAEFKGINVGNNPEYIKFSQDMLKTIFDENQEGKKQYGVMFNTEFVPAENLGVKNAKWDSKDGYMVNRNAYNSYFYSVEDESTNIIDKFILHGKEINQYLDGGSALHVNLNQLMNKDSFMQLFNLAAKTGCNYFCTNVRTTICNTCNNIDKNTLQICPKCGSLDLDYATRIIGYLKKVSDFSSDRQNEEKKRHYHG